MFALFHTQGILVCVDDLLNKQVIGFFNSAHKSLSKSVCYGNHVENYQS